MKKELEFSALVLLFSLQHFSEVSCMNLSEENTYVPHGPLVNCTFLPLEFLECDEPIDHKGNKTAKDEVGYGCVKFGGYRYEDVEKAAVHCRVFDSIECAGPRKFLRGGFPCIRLKCNVSHICWDIRKAELKVQQPSAVAYLAPHERHM
ncbi:TM2 domain-containing protein 2 isoform X2 [Anabrus simplex]|uniref:TM2 domain-containing protein 2 isoform X2 n=1 Tax=Anabrus simplex TaxID=316456 RepID=UPI0034DD6496